MPLSCILILHCYDTPTYKSLSARCPVRTNPAAPMAGPDPIPQSVLPICPTHSAPTFCPYIPACSCNTLLTPDPPFLYDRKQKGEIQNGTENPETGPGRPALNHRPGPVPLSEPAGDPDVFRGHRDRRRAAGYTPRPGQAGTGTDRTGRTGRTSRTGNPGGDAPGAGHPPAGAL